MHLREAKKDLEQQLGALRTLCAKLKECALGASNIADLLKEKNHKLIADQITDKIDFVAENCKHSPQRYAKIFREHDELSKISAESRNFVHAQDPKSLQNDLQDRVCELRIASEACRKAQDSLNELSSKFSFLDSLTDGQLVEVFNKRSLFSKIYAAVDDKTNAIHQKSDEIKKRILDHLQLETLSPTNAIAAVQGIRDQILSAHRSNSESIARLETAKQKHALCRKNQEAYNRALYNAYSQSQLSDKLVDMLAENLDGILLEHGLDLNDPLSKSLESQYPTVCLNLAVGLIMQKQSEYYAALHSGFEQLSRRAERFLADAGRVDPGQQVHADGFYKLCAAIQREIANRSEQITSSKILNDKILKTLGSRQYVADRVYDCDAVVPLCRSVLKDLGIPPESAGVHFDGKKSIIPKPQDFLLSDFSDLFSELWTFQEHSHNNPPDGAFHIDLG